MPPHSLLACLAWVVRMVSTLFALGGWENSGYWQVDRRDRASLVTYALAVRAVLPAFLTRAAERDSLVDTINGLRRLAERS